MKGSGPGFRDELVPQGGWPVAGAALLASLALALFATPALLESWLLAFLLFVGLSVGATGLLMLGHLLAEKWLEPIRAEIEALARVTPLALVLVVPLVVGAELLYPLEPVGEGFTSLQLALLGPEGFRLRIVGYVVLWTGLALLIARPGHRRLASAIGLPVLLLSMLLADLDLLRSRELAFWSSLQGLSLSIAELLAALALVALWSMRRPGRLDDEEVRALRGGLLLLALLLFWGWGMQLLVVWSGNLPNEAAWYLAREGGWRLLQVVAALALLGACALLLPHEPAGLRFGSALVLLLAQHLAQLFWLVRPPVELPPLWLDALGLLAFGAAWWTWVRAGVRRQATVHEAGRVAHVREHGHAHQDTRDGGGASPAASDVPVTPPGARS